MRRETNPQAYGADYDDQPTARLPAVEPRRQAPPRRARQANRPRRRRGIGMTLLIALIGVVALAVIMVAGFQLASDNVIKPLVANRVEPEIDRGVERFVSGQLASMSLPVNAPQEVMVSEAELNRRIAEQGDLGPLDGARAEINSDGVVVHMDAYGLSGAYRAQVGVEGGRAVLQGGSINGPLGYVIPVGDLEEVANEAIARSLDASDIRVTSVTLVDGEMVLTLESTGAGNDAPSG
ncbi:MAG TPA: hypothetical protein VKZ96_09815 [Thermomicrobiales bacterium]|nr:hypothetical protein [Thermomicrobiales bacterium]